MPPRQLLVTINAETRAVTVEEMEDGRTRLLVDGQERLLDVRGVAGRCTWFEGTRVVSVEAETGPGGKLTLAVAGHAIVAEVKDAAAQRFAEAARLLPSAPAGPTSVRSSMPGRIVKVLVSVGDDVKAGRGLVVVEAMKMENEIRAPRDGKVREIRFNEGVAVEAGQDLVVLD